MGYLIGTRQGAPSRRGSDLQSELPTVEVRFGETEMGTFGYARTAQDRADAWLQYVTNPKRVVMEWEAPGRFVLVDVPPGWAVVWVQSDGMVVGSAESPGSHTNLLLAPQMVTRAILVEKSRVPLAGSRVTVLVRTTTEVR